MNLKELREMADSAFSKLREMLRASSGGLAAERGLLKNVDDLDQSTAAAVFVLRKNFELYDETHSYAEEVEWIQFLFRWRSLAYPTFHLTHDAAGAALLTDCSTLDPDDLNLPFPCFALHMPSPSLITFQGIDDPVPTEAGIVLIQRYLCPDKNFEGYGPDYLEFLATANYVERLRVTLVGRDAKATLVHTRVPQGCASIKKWMIGAAEDSGAVWPGGVPLAAEDKNALRSAIRLTVNSIVYVNDLRARATLDLGAPAQRAHHGTITPKNWHLRGPTKLGPELLAAARSMNDEPQWRLKSRFVVRGHWRNQPHGPENRERYLKWIAPYWKGPQDGEVMERTYNIDSISKPKTES